MHLPSAALPGAGLLQTDAAGQAIAAQVFGGARSRAAASGVLLPVPQGGTGLSAGTSGGVPYFSSTTTMASSAVLSTSQIVLGGGAGGAPAPLGSLGLSAQVLHGNAAGVPSWGAVSLTADVSGTLPIANGGTGQTSASAAFGALSPLTTKGDVLAFSTLNARLGVGTDGQVLTADSAQVAGLKWATPTTGTVTSVSVTTAAGVSGSVATATTTPAITITLGAITPSSVTSSGALEGTRLNVTGNTAPTNGVYLPAANSVSTATNGTERVRVDVNGNVGLLNHATNPGYQYVLSTGANCYFGAEGSGGSDILTGAGAYSAVVGTGNTTALALGTNSVTRLKIDASGNVILGASGALSTSATDGFAYIPTCAGAPSGVPTSATGKVPLVYDTTNNKLYAYNGAWKSSTFT